MAAGLALLDEVRWNGAPVPGDRSHALLAALALESSRPVGDARLVAEVWGDDVPANPTKALQVLVSRTRAQTDASLVLRNGHGYRLGEHPVDARALSDAARDARRALSAGDPVTARDLAREALAVPVSGPGVGGGPVEQLHRRAAREQDLAREILGRALEATGQHVEALGLLEPLVGAHPEDEGLLEALLRCELVVRGAPAALERYERHRDSVRDALGTDPGPALQRLHAELLARDRPVREGLLHDASRLIGRDDDVTALTALLRTSRVTSVLGAGGLGKTRLAHVMGRLAEQPVVHFVELAGVTSPDGVAVEVGSALGVRESGGARRLQGVAARHDLVGRILEQVGTAPTLLILDNCEHVVEAVADLVAVLVARTAQLRVLTTTRAPLGLASERVYPLSQLAVHDAVELFRERATSARPAVRLAQGRVASLVGRLDGLPLAVELAAAKVRVMSVEEIERRLENRFALLRGGSRDAPERHQTLLAVIDWSWNLLTQDERVALRRLSVFRDGFTLKGAESLVSSRQGPDVLDLLTRLVDQSLVSVVDEQEADEVRYRLLETVREFGRMQLVDAGDDRVAQQRLRAWAVALRDRELPRLDGREQVSAMTAVRAEEGNLVDVLRGSLADADVATVVPVMALLCSFWMVEGNHLKVVNVAEDFEAVLISNDVAPDLDEDLRVALSSVVMNTMIILDAPSATSLERLRRLGPGDGRPRARAMVRLLTEVTRVAADPRGALPVLEALAREPDRAMALLARQWTSLARENAGDAVGSIEAAEAALELCDDEDGPWARALLTSQLAGLCLQLGDADTAVVYAEQALPVMDLVGAVDDAMQLRSALVVARLVQGDVDAAAALLEQVARANQHQSLFGSLVIEGCGRAEVALARGEIERGLSAYLDAAARGRAVRLPGYPAPSGLEPWVLYPEAGAVAAHARHAADRALDLRDSLVGKATRLLAADGGSLDFPVVGSVLFAVGAWDLSQPDADPVHLDRAVRLLASAEAFAYNRGMPSLRWDWAAELAERRRPGVLAEARAGVDGRSAFELRDDVRRLVAALVS